jgi:hypothetical protein
MPDLKLLRIEDGDSQKVFVDKINSNFSNILSFGGGPYGRIGKKGPQGDQGTLGPAGSYGDPGQRGNIWTVGGTSYPSSPFNDDFWIDVFNFNKVYQYENGSWLDYGLNLSAQDLFRIYGPLVTASSGVSNRNGYFITSQIPESYTVVLSDNNFDSSPSGNSVYTFNPQYSKMVLSVNSNIETRKLLEFTKADYQIDPAFYSKTPRFLWATGATADRGQYGLKFESYGGFSLDIQNAALNLESNTSSIRLNSTGFNINLNSTNPLTMTSAGGNIVFDFSSTGTALFSASNIKYANNTFTIPVRTLFISGFKDANPPLWLNTTVGSASGLRHKSTVSTNRNSFLMRILDITDVNSPQSIFNVLSNGDVYYNRKIDSVQPSQSVTNSVSANVTDYYGTVSCYWTTVIPTVAMTAQGQSNMLMSNNGVDFVFDPTRFNGDGLTGSNAGISLWLPSAFGGTGSNRGWLNLLDDHECITIRVKSSSSNKMFRYLGINTNTTQNSTFPDGTTSPGAVGNGQVVDLSSGAGGGASAVDFTIMNISGTGPTGASYRWFKVYYSAYGPNLWLGFGDHVKCGVLYTVNSTPF